MKRKKLVIDTNVVVSAVIFGGEPGKLLRLWQGRKIIFLVSREILDEYIKVFSYPKFQLPEEEIKDVIMNELMPYMTNCSVTTEIDEIREDPEDNKFLELAVDGKAQYIISGDRHLLKLKNYKNIKILTVKEFLGLIEEQRLFQDFA